MHRARTEHGLFHYFKYFIVWYPARRQQSLRSSMPAVSLRKLTRSPCSHGSNKDLVLPCHAMLLQVMKLGVKRAVKGPQPPLVIRRGMAVPTATVGTHGARPWGWIRF